jgi:hypothetical protein
MARPRAGGHPLGACLCGLGHRGTVYPQGRRGAIKFLLNMNLPRRLADSLRALGRECGHSGDIGFACASERATSWRKPVQRVKSF